MKTQKFHILHSQQCSKLNAHESTDSEFFLFEHIFLSTNITLSQTERVFIEMSIFGLHLLLHSTNLEFIFECYLVESGGCSPRMVNDSFIVMSVLSFKLNQTHPPHDSVDLSYVIFCMIVPFVSMLSKMCKFLHVMSEGMTINKYFRGF